MAPIDWLVSPDRTPGITKNYVFGCNYGCIFCYGKRIARRHNMAHKMADVDTCFMYGPHWPFNPIAVKYHKKLEYNFYNFIPTFRPSVLAKKLPKKSTMIFFSMSDPAYWQQEWYEKILEKICDNFQHTFVILTKQPSIYQKYTFPLNCWLGVTCVNQSKLNEFECFLSNYLNKSDILNKVFISLEPLQENIKISGFMEWNLDWIIVGFETGQRKEKITGQKDWLNPFWNLNIPVFMKKSCKITTRKLRQEWPEGYLNA